MYSDTIIDLNRKEHMDSLKEALLFCCVSQGPKEQKIAAALHALKTCAKWFPTEKE